MHAESTPPDSGEAGHHPIEDRHARRIFALQYVPSFGAVAGHHHFIAPSPERGFEEVPGDDAIVGNQNAHVKLGVRDAYMDYIGRSTL